MSQYTNKTIVAPMVRVSTLPFRLLCLDYGADLVYTDEIIDFKMLNCRKIINDEMKTVDFEDLSDGTIHFRTCAKESSKVIFQMGTCDFERALKVARLVEKYVAGIDINMGCPKEFSIKGGMGAALLTQPEKVKQILSTLTANLNIPVTCKIRILPSIEETLQLCKIIECCGVAAIAVHGRTRTERPNHANHNDVIKIISEHLKIPVIANGGSKEIDDYEGIGRFRKETGASSVMLARAAMWNCSILRREGPLPGDTVIKDYLKYCILYDNAFTYTKYTVQNILRDRQSTDLGKAFLETQTLQEICALWGLKDFFDQNVSRISPSAQNRQPLLRPIVPQSLDDVSVNKCVENGVQVYEMAAQFIRGNYGPAHLPKLILHNYIAKNGLEFPTYTCKSVEKCFLSELKLGNVIYRSKFKEKNKRYSEQGAALVCLHVMGIVEKTYGFVPLVGTRKHANFTSNVDSISAKNKQSEALSEHQNISKNMNEILTEKHCKQILMSKSESKISDVLPKNQNINENKTERQTERVLLSNLESKLVDGIKEEINRSNCDKDCLKEKVNNPDVKMTVDTISKETKQLDSLPKYQNINENTGENSYEPNLISNLNSEDSNRNNRENDCLHKNKTLNCPSDSDTCNFQLPSDKTKPANAISEQQNVGENPVEVYHKTHSVSKLDVYRSEEEIGQSNSENDRINEKVNNPPVSNENSSEPVLKKSKLFEYSSMVITLYGFIMYLIKFIR